MLNLFQSYHKMSDAELMRRFQRDDVKAFEQILNRYEKRILGFFIKYFSDEEVAKDLTQDCFIRIIDKKAFFDCERNFQPWIFRIASNLANSYYRINQHIHHSPIDDHEFASNDESSTDKKALNASIRQGINLLSEEHKAVFILRHFNQLSINEIAETLEIKEGTVKSRLYYAHQTMKSYIIEQEIKLS